MQKTLFTIALLFCFFFGSARAQKASNTNTSNTIDLRYNPEDLQEGQKLFNSGLNKLFAGLLLNAAGTSLALLAPELANEPQPVDHASYQEQLSSVSNNPDAVAAVSERYQDAISAYNTGWDNYQSTVNTLRGVGVGTVVVGATFDIIALNQMKQAVKKALR